MAKDKRGEERERQGCSTERRKEGKGGLRETNEVMI